MAPKRFFFSFIAVSALSVILIVGINVYIDIFGVFGYSEAFEKRIYGDERRAKFLLANKYIPENYNAVILGPSLSANIDPAEFQSLKFFNASVVGGRIGVIRRIYSTLKENGGEFDVVLISLNPFILAADDYEDDPVWEQTYRSALGSYNLLVYYGFAVVRNLGVVPRKFPVDKYDLNGRNNFEKDFRVVDVEKRVRDHAKSLNEENFQINENARNEFVKFVAQLEEDQATVVFFNHPMPSLIYEEQREAYDKFYDEVKKMIDPDRTGHILLNYNNREFSGFTSDFSNYIDHWHFSDLGQERFLEELKREINQLN